ncbi:interferon alpha-inducible protein 27-like protein 2A isoform X2 [Lates calcarifer]|uniref:Interferon alpha-inducible protein 27-like protein 2A isoform X2 n=1 Tax=Lates calcarifer TaxID=8187 RepID=A0AAJ8DX22_LATCA|nr:interferon alpha-inducible protein 27-like protein 2A isoform X2 [Lates calcarifer]
MVNIFVNALSWIASLGYEAWMLLMALWDFFFNYKEEICKTVVIGAGGVMTVTLTPALLAAMGFTSGGIVAGSLAAKIMSYCAIANGGGVAAGGLVAFLQSIGAAGLSGATSTVVAAPGAAVGWMLSTICNQTGTS